MLLISPTRAALAMGTQCRSATGVDEPATLEALRLITAMVEGVLEVETLSAVTQTDTFLFAIDRKLPQTLRLTNGFLDSEEPVVIDGLSAYGLPLINPDAVNLPEGIITPVANQSASIAGAKGVFTVTYTSGFPIPAYIEGEDGTPNVHPDPEYRVAENVPDWIALIVVELLVMWRRTNNIPPQVTKEYGFLPTLNTASLNFLRSSIYRRYMRPRTGLWPHSTRIL